MIIGKINEDKLIDKLNKLEKKLQREINYTLYSKDEFEEKKDKRNSFILDIIQGKKITIIASENE